MDKLIDIKYKIYHGEYTERFFVGDFVTPDEVTDTVTQLIAEGGTSIQIDIKRVPTEEVRKVIHTQQQAEKRK